MSIDKTDDEKDLKDAIAAIAETGGNFAYAFIAFGATYTISGQLGLEAPIEPAVLNAGLAYYSHAASGRMIRAATVLYRAKVKHVAVVTMDPTTQAVEEEHA